MIISLLVNFVARIHSLPYQRDGFWVNVVQEIFPKNRVSNWEGAWIQDDLPYEMFSEVNNQHIVLYDGKTYDLHVACRTFLKMCCSTSKMWSSEEHT